MDIKVLRNLLTKNIGFLPLSASEKVLAFYRMAIELERMKEPDIKEYFDYPINYKGDRIMLIDFPCNEDFHQKFENNRNPKITKFPSDLYIGLTIKTQDTAYRLLNIVIDFNEIKDICIEHELLPIRIVDFEVNLQEASRLELLPDKIERINTGIKENPTWQGILAILKQEISEDVTITDNLYLALSSKSIELSQIYSELNNKRLQQVLTTKDSHILLNSFLLNEAIDNTIDNVEEESLLCVTKLDRSQKRAILEAMNSKISVITGAPGTGKTQVIENILVNALIQGKKVLVASKNNKAVDNIKDRFDGIDKTGYFLRFGTRQYIHNNTLPSIEHVSNEIAKSGGTAEYETCKEQYEHFIQNIKDGKKDLARIEQLQNELLDVIKRRASAQANLQQCEAEHSSSVESINAKHMEWMPLSKYSEEELNRYMTKIKTLDNNLTVKFSGFFGFWHRNFSVKKYTAMFLNEVEHFPFALKSYGSQPAYKFRLNIVDFNSHHVLFEQIRKWQSLIGKGIGFKKELVDEQNRYTRQKTDIEKHLEQLLQVEQQKKGELENFIKALPVIQSRIEEAKKWIQENGLRMLSAYICYHKNKYDKAVQVINSYKCYLPDQIPWKDTEYESYISRTKRFLDIFRLCSVTSLSTKNAFPMASELFDMVVIDEASQCDIASALPLIMRAKQLVVIGDPMQLRHISAIKLEEEQEIKAMLGLKENSYVKYAEHSLYDYCKDYVCGVLNGQPYMLKSHYRCFPSIITYSNNVFYDGLMGAPLEIKTDISRLKGNPRGIVLVDVKGRQANDNVNVNEAEAKKSIELAIKEAQSNPDISIGIVTPFRHQAERINLLIPDPYVDRIEANTVHKYQGDEKDVMIYSLVVTSNSPDRKIYWIDNIVPNLVNVAVTRAKSTLYVVGNIDYVKAHSDVNKPLGYLVRYNMQSI